MSSIPFFSPSDQFTAPWALNAVVQFLIRFVDGTTYHR
jgi:hypothetical protein